MVEMDREQKKKWHKIGVICAEFIMVASVVAIVVITTLIAMGWNVNRDGEIEQTGLLQLHTMPAGATVEIDGETMFARTDMSRSLSPGRHYIKASREGYDTWEKEIEMDSGRLMRVYYPRLFAQNRKTEQMMELGAELEFYSAAPNHKYLLWAKKDAAQWQWVDVSGDRIDAKTVDVSEVFDLTDDVFSGEILDMKWSYNGEKVLTKVKNNDVVKWYLLNLREIAKSRDLTADFGLDFATVKIMDAAADKLWTLENGNLRLVNAASRESSRILVSGVEQIDTKSGAVAYLRVVGERRWVGVYREGEQGAVDLYEVGADATRVWLSKYYNEDYLAVVQGQKLTVYKGMLPSYNAEEKIKVEEYLTTYTEKELEFQPERLAGGPGDEYVGAWSGARVAMLDLERGDLYNYEAGVDTQWLDDSMLYRVADGALTVWDFDGSNKRELASGVTADDAMINSNNKYLYYIQAGESLNLVREQIII